MPAMTPGTPLNNVAFHLPFSCLRSALIGTLLASALILADSATPAPRFIPLPSKGGSLDAWAASSTVDAAGLAVDFCVDSQADSAAHASCKQNVMIDSTTCSQQCKGCGPHDRSLRYEACMDGSLFKSPCESSTRERFFKEAMSEARSKVPTAWSKGVKCKEANLTKDAIFSSFWDALCSRNGSAACFLSKNGTNPVAPLPKPVALPKPTFQMKTSLLRVGNGANYKRQVYQQWLRHRVANSLDLPSDCRRSTLLQRLVVRSARKQSSKGRRTVRAASSATLAADPNVPKLPEQGYAGTAVRHMNMKSITSDWGSEYGPTTQKPLWQSSAQNSAIAVSVAAMLVVAHF